MLTRWQSTIVDAQGNIQPFAILTILNEETQAPAQIYASESESQPLPAGTVVADESGYAYFYARGGRYRIQADDLSIDWRHVPMGSAATRDVVSSDNDTSGGNKAVTQGWVDNSMNSHVLGMGQTWQNMTASRSADTTYTNTTGRPIQVLVTGFFSNGGYSIYINGNVVKTTSASDSNWPWSFDSIIPAGATYRIGGTNNTIGRWVELR